MRSNLVDLHCSINRAHKPVAGVEAHSSSEHKEGIGDDEHVAEVQDPRYNLSDVKLREEVERCIQEEV